MRKNVKILLILILLVFPCSVYALEACKVTNLSDADIKTCDIKTSSKMTRKKSGKVQATITSSYYNAKDDGLVTPVKNQYNIGACWAFSAISNIETNALKRGLGTFDLSEAHLIYGIIGSGYNNDDIEGKTGKYNTNSLNDGGISYYAASYFFNNQGQFLESEYAYPGNPVKISSSDYPEGRNILGLDTFEIINLNDYSSCTNDEISAIKQKILDNGSVNAFMYINENYFKGNGLQYYLAPAGSSNTVNHGVTIVGWNDSISKNYFNGATRDGAWIIKNSYGTSWSGDGYFYISYDDNFVCKDFSTFSGVNTNTYDYTHQSSDLISLSGGFLTTDKFYSASYFKKDSSYDEVIKKVSVGLPNDANYKVYLSPNNMRSSIGDWTLIGSGHSDSLSVRSIYTTDITVTRDFTIIVEIEQDSDTKGIYPTMCSYDPDFNYVSYSQGVNYVGTNPSHWTDLYEYRNGDETINCEPIIYVYTDSVQDDGAYSKDENSAKIVNKKIYVRVDRGNTFNPKNLSSVTELIGKDYILDKSNKYVTNAVGTGSKVYFADNSSYDLIVRGDANGDAAVDSGDLVRIVKSLKKTITLNDIEKEAADANSDDLVDSGDLVKIVKYLKGTSNIVP